MATTNLISKSLGDVLLESGNGSPDHTSPKGSIYVDMDSASAYQNIDGVTNWQLYNTVAYGIGYYQDNTTATTISNTGSPWTLVSNNLTLQESIGVTVSGGSMGILSGYEGDYSVRGEVTISYVAGTNNYEVGLSIDGNAPGVGAYNGTQIDATFTRQHIGFDSIVSLTASTTLELAVRNITNTDNVIIRHAQLFIKKLT
jgi:hypothetical protein